MAVASQKIEAITELVAFCEANMEIEYAKGGTALHFSAFNGNRDVVKALLDSGMATELRDNDNMTALHAASWGKQGEAAYLLCTYGANVDAIDNNGMTPLHAAAESGSLEATLILLRNNANTLVKDNDSHFALVYAGKHFEQGEADVFNAIHEHNGKLFKNMQKKAAQLVQEQSIEDKAAAAAEAAVEHKEL
jgi:ankyrin repeat protein